MKHPRIITYMCLLSAAVIAIVGSARADRSATLPAHDRMQEGIIRGPFQHRNLQVFLIHGSAELQHLEYVTLGEAIEKGFVVIKETGSVQELTIENRSKDKTVFVHAGDVLKGGRQDRTIRNDLILPPLSGPVPVASLCVESGRWSRRGGEDADKFSANKDMLTSRMMRIASREANDQAGTWREISRQQTALDANVSALSGSEVEVRDSRSRTSLQLTLESKELQKVIAGYEEVLKPILDGKTEILGFVYAINGQINTAEVYNNEALFRALWPKLIRAAIVEAVSEYREGIEFEPLSPSALPVFFKTALSGSPTETQPWKTTILRTYTTEKTILFETLDAEAGKTWIHKTFINRGDIVVPLTPRRQGGQLRLRNDSPSAQIEPHVD